MPKVYIMPDDRVERVAVWGTNVPTDEQRAAFEAENSLTFAGTPAEVDTYLATLEAEIAAAPVVEPPPPLIPAERAAIYDEMAGLLTSAGITEIPANYDEAIAAVEAYMAAQTTVATTRAASILGMKLLARRQQLMENGGSWAEALRHYGV